MWARFQCLYSELCIEGTYERVSSVKQTDREHFNMMDSVKTIYCTVILKIIFHWPLYSRFFKENFGWN